MAGRWRAGLPARRNAPPAPAEPDPFTPPADFEPPPEDDPLSLLPVSYTHLTLPTILLV